MHIYLYDFAVESCRQLTSGEWVVRAIERWDETRRLLFFSAAGREEPGVIDPYLRHLYVISVDEPAALPTLLTPEPADHEVKFSPCSRWFTDCYSRADLPTVAVLRAASDGRVLLRMEAADLEPLVATGWKMPQPFVTKAPDGATQLYSLFWPPSVPGEKNESTTIVHNDMQILPDSSVPVLENIYTGPHSVSKSNYSNTTNEMPGRSPF